MMAASPTAPPLRASQQGGRHGTHSARWYWRCMMHQALRALTFRWVGGGVEAGAVVLEDLHSTSLTIRGESCHMLLFSSLCTSGIIVADMCCQAFLGSTKCSMLPHPMALLLAHTRTAFRCRCCRQGLLSGLISTVMQAGFHFTASAGIDLLNLWPAVAGVNPLQFRMSPEQVGAGREREGLHAACVVHNKGQ